MRFATYLEEGIRAADFKRAAATIVSYLEKSVGSLYAYPEMEHYSGAAGNGIGLRYFLQDGSSLRFNWTSTAASSKLDSISLWDGSTKYPNFQIRALDDAPLGSISLTKVLPTLVQIIKNPVAGEVEVSTSESIEVFAELNSLLIEKTEGGVLNEDAYDDVLGEFENGPVSNFTMSKLGRNQERIFKELVNKYKDAFSVKTDGAGRQRYTLVGEPDDFDRDEILNAVMGANAKRGRVGFQVSGGGDEEVSTDGEAAAMKQYPQALKRIPYEEQLDDMKTIVGAVAKGASNFAIVLGAGGLGKCFCTLNKLHVTLGKVE